MPHPYAYTPAPMQILAKSQLIQLHAAPLDSKSAVHAVLHVSLTVFYVTIFMFSTLLEYWLPSINFHQDMGKSLILQIPGIFLKSSQQSGVFEIWPPQGVRTQNFKINYFWVCLTRRNCELSCYFISCLMLLFKIMPFIHFFNFPWSVSFFR